MSAQAMNIPLRQLEANAVALREVDAEDADVLRLFDSIKRHGILNSIKVTPAMQADGKTPKTLDDGSVVYRVVDGLHRFTGATKAGLESVPCLVESLSDMKLLMQQLEGNLHRIPTKPAAYGAHLKRIIALDQTRTKSELANELSVSLDFLDKRLSLNHLHQDGKDENGEPTSTIGKFVDAGKITISNAVELAKLKPSSEQLKYVQDAMTDQPLVFAKKIKDRIKEINDAARAARDPNEGTEFSPIAHLRKKAEVEAEVANPAIFPVLLKAAGITDPGEVATFVLKWLLHLDEQSVAEAKAKHDQREKERTAEQAAAKVQRAEKATAEAKAAQAKAQAAASA